MTDPVTLTAGDGTPYLAVDVQPDNATGVFRLDYSELDSGDGLSWSDAAAGVWANIVCDVMSVNYRRGVDQLGGPVPEVEAGTCVVVLSDTSHSFDPMTAGDAIHKGTPLRLRAWGYQPVLAPAEVRRNRVPNPAITGLSAAGWTANYGTGGSGGTVNPISQQGPPGFALQNAARMSWTVANTAVGTAQLRADGRTAAGRPITVVPGEKVSAAIYTRASITQRLACAVTFFDASGAQTGITPTSTAGAAQVVPANTWQRLIVENVTVPANATRALVVAQSVSGTGAVLWPAGAWQDATMAQLVSGPTVGAYFDGNTADPPATEGALSYSWAGTPGQSASVESVLVWVDDAWEAVLWTGSVDKVRVRYLHDGPPEVTITGQDLVADLVAWESEGFPELLRPVPAGMGFLGQYAELMLAHTGTGKLSPASDTNYALDGPYWAPLNPMPMAHPWQELVSRQEAELGRLWVDRDNRLVARGNRSPAAAGPVRGTFSDVHGETIAGVHVCLADAAVIYGLQGVNRVLAGRSRWAGYGPDLGPDGELVRADNEASQARHGLEVIDRRDLELSYTVGYDAAAGVSTYGSLLPTWARLVLEGGAAPGVRVESVDPAPSPSDLESALQAWPAVLATDVGDRWVFLFHPSPGLLVAQTIAVLGIELQATPDAWTLHWVTEESRSLELDLDVGLFVLDHSPLSWSTTTGYAARLGR